VELVRDEAALRGSTGQSISGASSSTGKPARFESLAGVHDRPVALVRYRDHVAGGLQPRTQRLLLAVRILAIDGRRVLPRGRG
jgi:hypothetical protein